jgi:hypothetical protein
MMPNWRWRRVASILQSKAHNNSGFAVTPSLTGVWKRQSIEDIGTLRRVSCDRSLRHSTRIIPINSSSTPFTTLFDFLLWLYILFGLHELRGRCLVPGRSLVLHLEKPFASVCVRVWITPFSERSPEEVRPSPLFYEPFRKQFTFIS